MHREDIKAALRKSGSSMAAVARSLNCTPMAVGLVVKGDQCSKRVARAVSKATGLPVGKLWPGKYPEIEFLEKLADTKPAEIKAALKQAVPSASNPTKRSPAKRRAA